MISVSLSLTLPPFHVYILSLTRCLFSPRQHTLSLALVVSLSHTHTLGLSLLHTRLSFNRCLFLNLREVSLAHYLS